MLGDEALAAGAPALARFDAIVVGVRAFNTNERLRAGPRRAHGLRRGRRDAAGLQYNTNNRLAPLTVPIGPWPFDIGQKRVTDETAAVAFAAPEHPALTTPNAIGPRDFEGWVQERGLYFADKWDSQYETPLAMHDPGEAPQAGSLLWARSGKGTFVYTGPGVLPAAPGGRAGRLPAVRQPAGRRASTRSTMRAMTPRLRRRPNRLRAPSSTTRRRS